MNWVLTASTGNMNGENEVIDGYGSESEVDKAIEQIRDHGKPDLKNAIFQVWAEENGEFVKGTWKEVL